MINQINGPGNNCLMLACTGDPLDNTGLEVIELLLEEKVNVDVINKRGKDTPLTYAIAKYDPLFSENQIELSRKFEAILSANPSAETLNHCNDKGMSPLMRASEHGQMQVVKLLLNRPDINKWRRNLESQNRETAFHYAIINGHIKLATKYFMKESDTDLLSGKVEDFFSKSQLIEMATSFCVSNSNWNKSRNISKIFDDRRNDSCLTVIGKYAAVYDFYFDLLMKLIPLAPICIGMLNKVLPNFYLALRNGVQSPFSESEMIIMPSDEDLIFKLTRLYSALKQAIAIHPVERLDIQERLQVIEKMISVCFQDCDSMDDETNIRKSLCCALRQIQMSFLDPDVDRAQAFRVGPIKTALNNDVSIVLASANVSTFIDKIFWTCLKKSHCNWIEFIYYRGYSDTKKLQPFFTCVNTILAPLSKESENLIRLKSNLINGRYSPAFMFFSNCLSHVITLFLICWVTIQTYNNDFYDVDVDRVTIKPAEGALIIMSATSILTEIGELIGDGTETRIISNFVPYFKIIWNYFDLSTLTLLTLWVSLKFATDLPFEYSRAALAGATIFQATGTLRYSSFNESLGQYVILIIETILDLGAFTMVFLISVLGFWIFFFALFSDNVHFCTPSATFLNMFTASLGNYDSFTLLFGEEGTLHEIGTIVWLLYVVFSAIVLLNLIIAHMNSTYMRISVLSFQKFQLARAQTVAQFLLIYEKSTLCMLPAPLNLFTFLLSFVHYIRTTNKLIELMNFETQWLYLENCLAKLEDKEDIDSEDIKKSNEHTKRNKYEITQEITNLHKNYQDNRYYLSYAGTFADILCGLLASFVAPFYELFYGYLYQLNNKLDLKKSEVYLEVVFIVFIYFPISYPFYVVSLMIETIYSNRTYVALERYDDGYKCAVHFKPKLNCNVPIWTPDYEDHIDIKIIRGKFKNLRNYSVVRVQLRFGAFVQESGPSLYPGKSCTWSQETIRFPFTEEISNMLASSSNCTCKVMEIIVIDRDPVTLEERVIAHSDVADIRNWIANKRFEGELEFKNDNHSDADFDTLSLFVKVQYDTEKILDTANQLLSPFTTTPTIDLASVDSKWYTIANLMKIFKYLYHMSWKQVHPTGTDYLDQATSAETAYSILERRRKRFEDMRRSQMSEKMCMKEAERKKIFSKALESGMSDIL